MSKLHEFFKPQRESLPHRSWSFIEAVGFGIASFIVGIFT